MAISLTNLSTPVTRPDEDSNAKQVLKEAISSKWLWKTSELVNAVGCNESMFNEIHNSFLSCWRLIYENQAGTGHREGTTSKLQILRGDVYVEA